jgi:transcriptional regulator with XRE-family HTH domain
MAKAAAGLHTPDLREDADAGPRRRAGARRRRRDDRVGAYVARRVRDLRLARALTQEELAAALGVKRESVSRYESGERAITIALLLDIAAALGEPLAAFLPPEPPAAEPLAEIVAALRGRPDLIPDLRTLLAAPRREPS